MVLPLPKVVADVGPGGPLVTSMQGMNALANSRIENEIKAIEALYKPLTFQAQAASQLAYSSLMGPQFLAKLFNNPDFVAQLKDPQTQNAVNLLVKAGTGEGTGINFLKNLNIPQQQESPFSRMVSTIKNALGFDENMPSQQNQAETNAFRSSPFSQQQNNYPSNQNYQPTENPTEVQQAMAAWLKDPEAMKQWQQNGQVNIPQEPELLNWYRNKQVQVPGITQLERPQEKTYFKTAGEEGGKKEQRIESGKLRAKAIDEMDKQYQQALNTKVPIDNLIKMSQSPIFMKLKNKIPFFQDKQLKVLAKIGTPEEQEIIGKFITETQKLIGSTVSEFEGRAMEKEFDFAQRMKISDDDTWNVMIGKLAAIAEFNEMTLLRSRLAAKIMQQSDLNRGDALEQADKLVDGEKIRKSINERLHSNIPANVTIKNKKTGEIKTISREEARRLGVTNV